MKVARPCGKPEPARRSPSLSPRPPAVGGRRSSSPTASPASSSVAASQDATPGYGGPVHSPREAVSPPGEGWGCSISVTCTEKEELWGDRLGHPLSRRQRRDWEAPAACQMFYPSPRRGKAGLPLPRWPPRPASPGSNLTRDWITSHFPRNWPGGWRRGGHTAGHHKFKVTPRRPKRWMAGAQPRGDASVCAAALAGTQTGRSPHIRPSQCGRLRVRHPGSAARSLPRPLSSAGSRPSFPWVLRWPGLCPHRCPSFPFS